MGRGNKFSIGSREYTGSRGSSTINSEGRRHHVLECLQRGRCGWLIPFVFVRHPRNGLAQGRVGHHKKAFFLESGRSQGSASHGKPQDNQRKTMLGFHLPTLDYVDWRPILTCVYVPNAFGYQ